MSVKGPEQSVSAESLSRNRTHAIELVANRPRGVVARVEVPASAIVGAHPALPAGQGAQTGGYQTNGELPYEIGAAAGIQNAVFTTMVAGDPGRAAQWPAAGARGRRRRISRAGALHGLSVSVRAHVGIAAGGHDRGHRARAAETRLHDPMIPEVWYTTLSAVLFTIGVVGVVVRRNPLVIFMSIELMLNAVNLTFVAFAAELKALSGHVFVFFVMVVAAAEAAVGLAIIISVFRTRETLNVDRVNLLKL